MLVHKILICGQKNIKSLMNNLFPAGKGEDQYLAN